MPPGNPSPAKAADAGVVSGASAQLDYLSAVSVSLGMPDPVQEYFGPLVGRWRDLYEEADRWRRAAQAVEELAEGITSPLGQLDAVWHGAVSDSFLDHMRQVSRAATSTSDTMAAMADILDKTAEAMHHLVTDTVDLLAGGADRISLAMLQPAGGEARAGNHIADLHAHGRRITDAAHDLLEAFAQVCHSLEERQPFAQVPGLALAAASESAPAAVPGPALAAASGPALVAASGLAPAAAWGPEPPVPQSGAAASGLTPALAGGGAGHGTGPAPSESAGHGAAAPAAPPEPAMRTFAVEPGASSAAGQVAAGSGSSALVSGGSGGPRGAGGLGTPFMPMGAGMGGQGGGDTERRSTSNVTADPTEIFGEPTMTAPPVIGED
jgi:uncharacterized protein YukE